MQTTAIRMVANSLPENEVILLTLLISTKYIPYTDLLKKTDDSKTESCPVRQKVSTSERGVTPPKVMKKLKRDSSRSVGSVACKRKNNNPRSGCIRPAVVVFAFMPSAFALPSPCRYFLTLGASIMFIFLPSSFGIISTLANSSRSVAKRSSRISPCSLKTIERPRKKT